MDPAATSLARRATTGAVLVVLGVIIAGWLGSGIQRLLLQVGERVWPGYGSELRQEPTPPIPPAAEQAEAPAEAPKSAEQKADDDLVAALLAEEEAAAAAKDKAAAEAAKKAEVEAARARAEAARRRHEEEVRRYEDRIARRTPGLQTFAAIERRVSAACGWIGEHVRHIFVLLIAICAAVATAARHHVALRPIRSAAEDRAAQGVSLAANLLLLASVAAQWRIGAPDALIMGLWAATFGGMALVNAAYLVRPLPGAGGGGARALLCAPLYATMTLIAGAYFVLVEGYFSGLMVYLQKLEQSAQLYLQVGLYVWAGMLLKRTLLAPRALAVLRPWRLSPELLAAVLVAAAAFPTAYSGASGIFVIAAGSLIYRELREAGARPSLALASTAMSGSLGVVLSPCLLVMIIAYLDKDVASDELFGWGRWVYLLTAGLFAVGALASARGPVRPRPEAGALRASGRALAALWPHAAAFAGLLGACWLLFDARLDPHSAPNLLPLAFMLMLAVERRRGEASEPRAVRAATSEATVHIGALLLLMALSACLGGAIERSEAVAAVPEFASPWAAMTVLVGALVVIGMLMDPYGAAILVSATLAKVAAASGISAVHFWLVVLVAFELGYLTPPVALNHLLTRQVVDEADAAPADEGSWWRRHERYALPIAVMGTALVVVAFAPLLWG